MKTLTITLALALSMISFSYGEATPEKTAAVKSMFQVTGADKQMAGGFEAMLPMVDQLATQLQLTSEETDELKNIYRDWFENDIDRQLITDKVIQLYAEAFTIEEIKTLTDFYKTPCGTKVYKKIPGINEGGSPNWHARSPGQTRKAYGTSPAIYGETPKIIEPAHRLYGENAS